MKVLLIVVILAGVALVGWCVVQAFKALNDRHSKTVGRRHSAEFAKAAPDRVDNALSEPFIEQRRLLQDADGVIAQLLGDEINVYMPRTHHEALREWRSKYAQAIEHRKV